jgi:hypothetical protein
MQREPACLFGLEAHLVLLVDPTADETHRIRDRVQGGRAMAVARCRTRISRDLALAFVSFRLDPTAAALASRTIVLIIGERKQLHAPFDRRVREGA